MVLLLALTPSTERTQGLDTGIRRQEERELSPKTDSLDLMPLGRFFNKKRKSVLQPSSYTQGRRKWFDIAPARQRLNQEPEKLQSTLVKDQPHPLTLSLTQLKVKSERPATALTEGHVESKKEIELRTKNESNRARPGYQTFPDTGKPSHHSGDVPSSSESELAVIVQDRKVRDLLLRALLEASNQPGRSRSGVSS